MSLWICPTHGLHHGPFCCAQPQEYWDGSFVEQENDMNKETSSRVSTLAAEIMQTHGPITVGPITVGHVGNGGPGIEFIERRIYDELLAKAKTLAGSCMAQDETAGQEPETFLHRLKKERANLSGKIDALTLFLQRGAPGTSELHRHLLESQLAAMSLYLKTLDLRIQDLALQPQPIEKQAGVASEDIGEPREIGGHDEDRDGPIPFNG